MALHPALHTSADTAPDPLPLTARQFTAWSREFAAAMTGFLRIEIEPTVLSPDDVRQVTGCVEYVKKNSRAKRQIIKRP